MAEETKLAKDPQVEVEKLNSLFRQAYENNIKVDLDTVNAQHTNGTVPCWLIGIKIYKRLT